MKTQHLFIINPTAGRRDRSQQIEEHVKSLRLEEKCTVKITEYKGEAREYVKKFVAATDDFVRIYACGGDGTLNEVFGGVYGFENCAVGVIPIGSGNDYVRSLSQEYTDTIDIYSLLEGEIKNVDILRCGEIFGVNVASAGYDCAVGENMVKFKRLPFVSGSFAYKLSIVYCLFTKRKHRFRLFADGKEIDTCGKSFLLAISGNGKYYGGGIMATPDAELNDGKIDLVYITTVSVFTLLKLLGKFIKGKHIRNPKMPFVHHLKCNSIRFEHADPISVGFDGETFRLQNPVIEVLPGAQKVIFPF